MRVVPVPGRDVHAELEAVLPACVRDFPEHVSLPVPPGRLRYGVAAHRAGPQAEPVMMLGRDEDSLETGGLRRGGPLAAVQVRGVEEVLGLGSVAPFLSGECVRPEMTEHVHFHSLPFQLAGRRDGAVRLFRAGYDRKREGGKQEPRTHAEWLFSIALPWWAPA